MGIFRSNYDKPGPGVDKDAPKKKGLFLYLELLKRKFGKLMQASMLLFVCSIPMMIVMSFIFFAFISGNLQTLVEGLDEEQKGSVMRLAIIFGAVLSTTILGSGPASAGFAYITRCFTREEHAWIMSDFFQRYKENFKQSIIVSIVDVVAVTLGSNAIYFYFYTAQKYGTAIWMILSYISLMLMIVYMFMHIYIYQIMVTYECKMKDLYKNSLILALGKAPMNILLMGITVIIVFLVYNYLGSLLGTILMFLLFMGFARFPVEFYAARTISRIFISSSKGEE